MRSRVSFLPSARSAVGVAVAVGLLAAWQLWATASASLFVPPLSSAAWQLWHLVSSQSLMNDVVPSIVRLLLGFLIGAATSILVGIPIGHYRGFEPWVRPVLEFARAVPPPAVVPISVLLLGAGSSMRIAVIAFGSCWPTLLNAIDGARNVEPTLLDIARVSGMKRSEIVRRVVLPASLPQIFAGLRVSLAVAMIMMVVSEMISASSGLGYVIQLAQRTFEVPKMYGGVLLIGILGWILSAGFSVVERRILRWHFSSTGRSDGH